MYVFNVTQSVHQMPCVELVGGNADHHDLLRRATTTPWMNSPAYRLAKQAGAFLQGQDDGWTLVEFWRPDYQGFVDYLNNNV